MNKPLLPKMIYHPLIHASQTESKEQIIQRDGIKILTYNLFIRPPPIKTNEDDYKDERINDFKDKFEDFDIVCFQEMFGSFHVRKERMIKYAFEAGLFYHCESPLPSFFSKYLIDGGLLVLSRFPILESTFEYFDHGALSDSLSGKGVIYAKIKVEDMFIGLFVTHLQASYFDISDKMWEFSIRTRTAQSEYLINFIYEKLYNWDRSERNKTKFMLVGDFNIDYYDNEEQRQNMHVPKSLFNEYEAFAEKLNMIGEAKDLLDKKSSKMPWTFGVNDDGHDKVLTAKDDQNSRQTLDYIWELLPNFSLPIFDNSINSGTEMQNKLDFPRALKVNYRSIQYEDFKIENRKYQQLSDHFGLSVILEKPLL